MKTEIITLNFIAACLLALNTTLQSNTLFSVKNTLHSKVNGGISEKRNTAKNKEKTLQLNINSPVDSILAINNRSFCFNFSKDNYCSLKTASENYKIKLTSIWTPLKENVFYDVTYDSPLKTNLEGAGYFKKQHLKVRELPSEITLKENSFTGK